MQIDTEDQNKNSQQGENQFFDELEPDETPLEIPAEKRTIYFRAPTRLVKDAYEDYKTGDLDVRPPFQRGFVWDKRMASRMIESALLGVPLPTIYTAELEDRRQIVIDGQQRLLSFFSFVDGSFPKDGKPFKLRRLEVIKELNGKLFKDLGREVQRAIQNYSLPFIVITKDSNPDVKFEIFERLNTGSKALNDQELRNCIFRGKYNDFLIELADDTEFQSVLNSPKLKERMLDRELILRFFAYYHSTYLNYASPMKQFLNNELKGHLDLSDQEAAKLKSIFRKSVSLTKSVFGDHAFRRFVPGDINDPNGEWELRKINKGLFDIVMWGFSQYDSRQIMSNIEIIQEELMWLMTHDEKFLDTIRVSTDKLENVQYRFDTWRSHLKELIGYPETEPRCYSRAFKSQLYETNPTCSLCNQHISVLDDAEVDHIDFYWRGGKTIPSNARLTHRFCNHSRGGRD